MDNNLQEALNAVQKLKDMSFTDFHKEMRNNYQSYSRFEDILHQYQYEDEANYIHSFYMGGIRLQSYVNTVKTKEL